ncbi:DUF1203 domain-containing protein [Photobacterium sp. OFAV2-7]|uniref:DUF1203 domain-containing protein n=1 Tax=Photobacterium sp. OFAV2-7 TaxID=2917748 RepID=UPI001EF4070C|nr:DUF1203 domain-containing protein [Photobacterium sp. OFAV2-7]MCG7584919.1 DUF1203 domain-containing protein [Photobacterium sp. OFAV2-7]
MTTNFIVKPIEKKVFAELFNKSEEQLSEVNAIWLTADSKPGYPCRVSLKEAEVGERVLLIPYKYHDVQSPYQASGPIFIRENAEEAELEVNEIPEILEKRLLSVRAYNIKNLMIHAQTVQGAELEHVIHNQFLNSAVTYLQIHNANPGCFNCTVHRA